MVIAHNLAETDAHRAVAQFAEVGARFALVESRQFVLLETRTDHAACFLLDHRHDPFRGDCDVVRSRYFGDRTPDVCAVAPGDFRTGQVTVTM